MNFDDLFLQIKTNKDLKDSGKMTSILPPFPRFAEKFPGFEKGKYYGITASSGIAKTKFTKFYCITSVHSFCKDNNVKWKMKYFALEESEDEFWLSFISTALFYKFNKSVSVPELKSLGSFHIDAETLMQIKEVREYVEELMQHIDVVDFISNPTGLFKNVKEYAEQNGTFEKKDGYIVKYTPNDPEIYNFVVTDHISLFTPENDPDSGKMDLRQTMEKWSKEYALKGMVKRMNYIVIDIQQQESLSEKKQFTYRGESIEEKLLPSLSELADCKTTQRNWDVGLGVFSPARYEIDEFRGYNVGILKDNYRCVIILKDRWYGCANNFIHLYFDGASNIFKELPKAKDIDKLKMIYDYVRRKQE